MHIDAEQAAAAAAAVAAIGRSQPGRPIMSWLRARNRRLLTQVHGDAIVTACEAARDTGSSLEINHIEDAHGLSLGMRLTGPAQAPTRDGHHCGE